MRAVLAALALIMLLTACGTSSSQAPVNPPAEPADAAPAAAAPTQKEPPDPEPAPADTVAPDPPPAADEPASEPEPAGDLLQATPGLLEGPYYPSEADRPSDRDADLLLLTGSPVIASGDPLQLEGQLLDLSGAPVPDATIELWQTDSQGIYMHPDDPRVDARDSYFQSYGESVTDETGSWSFRTIVPARYENRPRHLHVKVRRGDSELLTTQIYIAGDPELDTDSLTAGLGDALLALTVAPEPGMDEVGFPIQRASHTLVVDLSRER